MADDTKNTQGAKKPETDIDNVPYVESNVRTKTKFSLLELTMILMIVGIIFVFWLPMQADKKMQKKVAVAIEEINKIATEDNAFKASTTFYFDDIKQMDAYKNLDQRYFTYALTDSAVVVATSTQEFGIKDAKIIFRLPTGPFEVGNDDTSKKYIDPYWLP
jgi:hypothetical protein